MTTDIFRWGVLGPGHIAARFAGGLDGAGAGRLYAAASRSMDRAQDFIAEHGGECAYDSYEAMLADAQIDGIYIATPHSIHDRHIVMCVEAGKPVLCEKPMTVNAAQAGAVFSAAQRAGVFVMEAMWSRFLPALQTARDLIGEGAIGEIVSIQSDIGFPFKQDAEKSDPARRWFNPDLAGGALLDLGVYPVSLSSSLLGETDPKIQASGVVGETSVDENAHAILTYPSGRSASFICSLRADHANRMEIFGQTGRITLADKFWQAERLTVMRGKKSETIEAPFARTGFEYQTRAAVASIRAGELECAEIPHTDTLSTLKTLDEIRRQIGQRYPFE